MKKMYCLPVIFLVGLVLFSCASVPSAVSQGPRTLILSGKTISEDKTDNGFTAWYCLDFVYDDDDDILVEVGFFSLQGSVYGFVL